VAGAAVTDADGAFAFDHLPAGRYVVAARSRRIWMARMAPLGQADPEFLCKLHAGDPPTSVFTMFRGATIAGVLRGASGEPAPGIDVAALRLPPPGDPPVSCHDAIRHDRRSCAYRIYGLMPGDYLVSSLMPSTVRLSDVAAMSAAQVDDALSALQRRAGSPVAPGADQASPALGTFGMTPVFFPGTPSADSATTITLGPAEERNGVDFTVRLTRMATIQGSVIDGGNPIKPLIINPSGYDMPSLTGNAPTFTSAGHRDRPHVPIRQRGARPVHHHGGIHGAGVAWARTDVEVSGADRLGCHAGDAAGVAFLGPFVFEGQTPPPSNMSSVQNQARVAEGLRHVVHRIHAHGQCLHSACAGGGRRPVRNTGRDSGRVSTHHRTPCRAGGCGPPSSTAWT
jgi:hypothetical protein